MCTTECPDPYCTLDSRGVQKKKKLVFQKSWVILPKTILNDLVIKVTMNPNRLEGFLNDVDVKNLSKFKRTILDRHRETGLENTFVAHD